MLTTGVKFGRIRDIKELLAVNASDIGIFLYPHFRGIRAENTLNIRRASNRALIASPVFAFLKRLLKTIGGLMRHIFNYNQIRVRTALINNKPFFCLADCRTALGIKGSLKVGALDAKGITKNNTITAGGCQELVFINEPNLYRLIFRSNKPEAQKFANWVYDDVLPKIRETGKYESQPDLFVAPPSKKPSIEKPLLDVGGLSFAQLFKDARSKNVEQTIQEFNRRELIEATEALKKYGVMCYNLGTLDAVFNLKAKGRIKV